MGLAALPHYQVPCRVARRPALSSRLVSRPLRHVRNGKRAERVVRCEASLYSTVKIMDLLSVGVFSHAGARAGRDAGLTATGATAIGMLTSIGGGTLRDIVMTNEAFWIRDPLYVFLAFAVSLLTSLLAKATVSLWGLEKHFDTALRYLNAGAIATFTIVGSSIGASINRGWVVPVITGFMSGLGGGIMRDICLGRKPIVLSEDPDLQALSAVVGSSVLIFLARFAVTSEVVIYTSMLAVAVTSLYGHKLPAATQTIASKMKGLTSKASSK